MNSSRIKHSSFVSTALNRQLRLFGVEKEFPPLDHSSVMADRVRFVTVPDWHK